MKRLNGVLIALLLAGCATQLPPSGQQPLRTAQQHAETPPLPLFNTTLFASHPAVVSPRQLFTLSAAQQSAFLADFNDRLAHLPAHQRIADYLHGVTFGFNYKEQTYTASEALDFQAGNCMALAIVTKSLADLAGVDLKFQRVRNAPVYDRAENVVMVSDHVRARLYLPGERLSWVTVDYFPSRESSNAGLITEQQFLALYYRNRAAELMLAGEQSAAFANAQEALKYQQNDASTLNIIALLHRRAGDDSTAEALFAYALAQNKSNLNVLYNYLDLAKKQNQGELVRQLQQKISSLPDYNPYTWIALAETAVHQGELSRALQMYEKAAYYAPYLHEIYWGQARVYLAMGRPVTAKRVLLDGLEQAKRSATKKSFKSGWYSFTNPQTQKKPH